MGSDHNVEESKEENEAMATLVRWDPFREVAALQNEVSRMMNGLFEGGGRQQQQQSWVPTVDAWETPSELVYAFDLPGIPQDQISVEFEEGAVTVSATRERSDEVSDERYHRLERRYGTFSRTVGVPQGVSEEAITASYKDGVLELHIPKPEQPKPKKIEIGFESKEPATIEGTSTQQ
jgi:HSP20 family protein